MLRELAEALISSGSPDEAAELMDELIARPDIGRLDRGQALVVLGAARLACGRLEAPLECFDEAATLLEALDPTLAVDALLRGAFVARLTVGPRATMNFAERARALAPEVSSSTRLQIDAAWGAGAVMLSRPEGFEVLSRTVETIQSEPDLLEELSASGWWPILWWMVAATITERFDEAQQAFEVGYSAAERMGWPGAMGAYLLAEVHLMLRLGRLDEAELALRKLESISHLIPAMGSFTMLVGTGLDLAHGRLSEAEKGCAQLETILELIAVPSLSLWVLWIRGRLEMSFGRVDRACETFAKAEQIAQKLEITEPCVTPWWVPAVDGYRSGGRFQDLERLVGWLELGTAGLPCRWPRACAIAGKALLCEARGDIDSARAHFADALAHIDGMPIPIDRAELLIWQGRFFHRQGDLASARRSFASAHHLAETGGVPLIAETACLELRRAGGRVRREKRPSGELTSRQAQVADLASMGRTSAEIAEALGIASRTVEHHLEAVYRRLGLSSRRDLMRRRYSGDPEFGPGDA